MECENNVPKLLNVERENNDDVDIVLIESEKNNNIYTYRFQKSYMI